MNEEPNIMDLIGAEKKHYPLPSPKAPSIQPVEETEHTPSRVTCWAINENNFIPVGTTTTELTPGCYEARMSDTGPYLTKVPIVTDNLIVLPDDASNYILDDFSGFWKMKSRFQERGFLHKRGILMFGPPGSGKTSTIQLIIRKVVEDLKGVVLMVGSPDRTIRALQVIRKIEPERPIICILEDLDALVQDHGESSFLTLLDGEAQVDNILFLATTNYPERLDGRFVDRPSRFDIVKYVGMPSAAARRTYLNHKEPTMTPEEVEDWVSKTEGLSIPHLKEMIISVKCYGRTLDETLTRLKQMHKKKFSSASDNAALGFSK